MNKSLCLLCLCFLCLCLTACNEPERGTITIVCNDKDNIFYIVTKIIPEDIILASCYKSQKSQEVSSPIVQYDSFRKELKIIDFNNKEVKIEKNKIYFWGEGGEMEMYSFETAPDFIREMIQNYVKSLRLKEKM